MAADSTENLPLLPAMPDPPPSDSVQEVFSRSRFYLPSCCVRLSVMPYTPPSTSGKEVFAQALVFAFLVLGLGACLRLCTSPTEKTQGAETQGAETAAEKQQELADWLTSGAKYGCITHLKQQLKDPDSYRDDGLFSYGPVTAIEGQPGQRQVDITWTFRSRNGFGGYAVGLASCTADTTDGGSVRATVLGE